MTRHLSPNYRPICFFCLYVIYGVQEVDDFHKAIVFLFNLSGDIQPNFIPSNFRFIVEEIAIFMLKNANFLGCLIQYLEFITIFAVWGEVSAR